MKYLVVHNVVLHPEWPLFTPDRIRFSGHELDEGEVDVSRLDRWRGAGYIVPMGSDVQLIAHCDFLSQEAKERLHVGGIFTVQHFLTGAAEFYDGEQVFMDAWMAQFAAEMPRWKQMAREMTRSAELAGVAKAAGDQAEVKPA